jgi:hypothetical protein
MRRLQIVTKKIVRQSPKIVAFTCSAGVGAFIMYRYCGSMNHLISVHQGIAAELVKEGGGFVFETPAHGSFVLSSIQKV